MMRAGRFGDRWRARFAALATLALALQLAVPPGFMVAPRAAGGPAIVICTGHGPQLAEPGDRGGPAKAPTGKMASLCPFVGHAGVPTIAPPVALRGAAFVAYADAPALVAHTAPGRGLAAPPPPSQAPPRRLA